MYDRLIYESNGLFFAPFLCVCDMLDTMSCVVSVCFICYVMAVSFHLCVYIQYVTATVYPQTFDSWLLFFISFPYPCPECFFVSMCIYGAREWYSWSFKFFGGGGGGVLGGVFFLVFFFFREGVGAEMYVDFGVLVRGKGGRGKGEKSEQVGKENMARLVLGEVMVGVWCGFVNAFDRFGVSMAMGWWITMCIIRSFLVLVRKKNFLEFAIVY